MTAIFRQPRRAWRCNTLVLAWMAFSASAYAADDQAKASQSQSWPAILVDGQTKQPLPGVKVEAEGSKPGESEWQRMEFTTDRAGRIEVTLPRGKATGVAVLSPGWWTGGFYLVGDLSSFTSDDGKPIVSDPAKPVTITLWKGTVVTGRLLRPDGTPSAKTYLHAGVYIHNEEWKKRLGMELTWNSWDHGEWPNWSCGATTGDDGLFSVTVPPSDARSWIRLGTAQGGFGTIDTVKPQADGKLPAIAEFAPFELNVPWSKHNKLNLTLRLKAGVKLRGRVLDADGKPLAGIRLLTSGEHGPYAGRSTESTANGNFEFQPMNPGTITLSPEARLRDEKGEVNSRDVAAVFVNQEVTILDKTDSMELTVQALPHVTLEFDWVDRRAKKGPVAYYGEFDVTGRVPRAAGDPTWWRGETEKATKNGREVLFVKVPKNLTEATLALPADQVVTASYEDDHTHAGPGNIALGDITDGRRRFIYGDEPQGAISPGLQR
jgi:hypothetical protein